jgi:ADP-glucose pyrophosphorylase
MKPVTNLLIMAGGASSRMKRSLENSKLSDATKSIAGSSHKSLIPLGKGKKPLLYYLIQNAVEAGYTDIYLVTSPENEAFQQWVGTKSSHNSFAGAQVHFAIQYTPQGRDKPLGTADAVQQAMDQYPILKTQYLTICNGDNFYSVKALALLHQVRDTPHAMISYARSGLLFDDERIAKFAVMDINAQNHLIRIIEKPDPETIEQFRDSSGEIRVSMNIFSFEGSLLYPYLKNCPIHPVRKEKELPEAVRKLSLVGEHPINCFPFRAHLPDLTSAEDILSFSDLE